MGRSNNDTDQKKGVGDSSLRALAFELKNPLINIARQAELADSGACKEIQQMAEQTLMLIDSYLLNAQSEYGQVLLDLAPADIGSVLYDVSNHLRGHVEQRNVSLVLDDRTHELVMTHRPALFSILSVFGQTLIGFNETASHQQVVLRGYKTREGKLGIGIFADIELSQHDLARALEMQGEAHMPLARINGGVHASLAIADGLCKAIGGRMTVKRMGRLRGLATELPRSEQLSFV